MEKDKWHPPEMKDWWDHLAWHWGGARPPSHDELVQAMVKWWIFGLGIGLGGFIGNSWTPVYVGGGVLVGALLFHVWRGAGERQDST